MPQRRSSKRRILIFSVDIGGVNRAVADALAHYLRSSHGAGTEVRVIDVLETAMPAVSVLARLAYQQADPLVPEFLGSLEQLSARAADNLVVRDLHERGLAAAEHLIDDFGADAVISTSALAGAIATEALRTRHAVSATVLPDFDTRGSWLHPETSLYFVATRDVREDLVVKGLAWERVVESGTPLRRPTADGESITRKSLGLLDRFTVLLAEGGGGGDLRDIAAGLLPTGVQVLVPSPGNARVRRRLESLAESEPNMHLLGQTSETNRMVAVSDLLVGVAGGTAVRGALAMGVPVIVRSPVPRQELGNVDYIVNRGAGLVARDQDDVLEKVHFLSRHTERLGQLRQNAEELGRSTATQTVCERVLAAIR